MEIRSFKTLPSTQLYALSALRDGTITESIAIITDRQTAGVGSRENSWQGGEGNFFASIVLGNEWIPEDLPLSSASIHYAYIMKEVLAQQDRNLWLKWPNDLYSGNEKVGGIITKKEKGFYVVGIGINLKKNQNSFSALDTDIPPLILLNMFLDALEKVPKWKQIFSKYQLEFEQNKSYSFHQNGAKKSMKNALLCSDGSLLIEGKKVYSLR